MCGKKAKRLNGTCKGALSLVIKMDSKRAGKILKDMVKMHISIEQSYRCIGPQKVEERVKELKEFENFVLDKINGLKTVGVRVSDEKLKERINKDCVESLGRWGHPTQWNMVIEECSELIQAITKYKRYKQHKQRDFKEVYNNLIEECVDVQIMLIQAFVMLDVDGTADYVFKAKLEKLESLLKKEAF